MKSKTPETIVAQATPPGRGGVAIVRISGPLTLDIAKAVLNRSLKPRYATFSKFYDEHQQSLDEGIAVFFPGPHSFTGEDVLELHGHGGAVVIDSLIKRILTLGARPARPGEFSERAFLNDKMDLTQAEAIADLIDAASTQAARSALRSLQGEFSKKINVLVEDLIKLRMYVEAAIDFAEEEVDFLADKQIAENLHNIIQQLTAIQTTATQGSLLREGMKVVITGEPNVGKSSLLNQLSGKDAAIVTHIPGTTRDVLCEEINIDGMPLHIVDTAGIRESQDVVEQEGIRRAWQAISQADAILLMMDASTNAQVTPETLKNFPPKIPLIIIHNKIDLTHAVAKTYQENNVTHILLSAKMGKGMEMLRSLLKSCIGFQTPTESTFIARRRHLDALAHAQEFLGQGQLQLQNNRAGELLAEDLRQAQQALQEITGVFTSDDLLGRIFSSFCIGK